MGKSGKRLSKKKQKSEFKTRVVRGGYPDRQFDIDFWQEQGAEAIFAAAWEMICFTEDFKYGKQPAFQRTVTNLSAHKVEFLIVGGYAVMKKGRK